MNVTSDVNLTVVLVVLIATIYTGVYIGFVTYVVAKFKILHGYPRYAELLPGQFVSDRYSWGWYFLMFNMARSFLIGFLAFSLTDLRVRWKRRWYERLVGYVLAFDVAIFLFFLITSCFLCNNSFWPSQSSLCNDELPKWCTVMGDSFPDRCPPALPLADQCDLSPNVVYVRWILFQVGFTVLDLLTYSLNGDMESYVYNSGAYYYAS
jgi:hypothetical protein